MIDSSGSSEIDEQRAARLARARYWVRVEFAIAGGALLAVATTVFVWLAQPGYIGPMVVPVAPTPVHVLVGLWPWLGVLGIVVGFAAMVRLSRLDPERGERTWRYRRAPLLTKARLRSD